MVQQKSSAAMRVPAARLPAAADDEAARDRRAQRLADILDVVAEHGRITVDELCALFLASHATVRRDLVELSRRGLVVRTRGGARAADEALERPVALRDARFRNAKRRIAAAAVGLLPPDRLAIALSGGTTTAEVARELADRPALTVVTNSLTIAGLAGTRADRQVVVTGGRMRPQSFELVGALAESTFSAIGVGIAILGADGVSARAGVTTHDEVEARANHAMVACARRTVVVADGSKIGRAAGARMAAADEIDAVVTDASADPDALDALRSTGVTIVVA